MAILFIPETNPHILLQRRAKKLNKNLGEEQWHASKAVKESPGRLLLLSLYRPMKVRARDIDLTEAPDIQPHCFVVGSFVRNHLWLYIPSIHHVLSQIPLRLTQDFHKSLVVFITGRRV